MEGESISQTMTSLALSHKTKSNPLIVHINPVGLFRMARSNKERFEKFNIMLNEVQNNGGNIAIPTYSYSYTKKEVYDVLNTPSGLDKISEYLRVNNKKKRTTDANFSYLLFGNGFPGKHFTVPNHYSSFGEESLIDDVFNKDGYLGAIGGILERLTEVHFIEKKLNVDYRFNKLFTGLSIDKNGKKTNSKITYFCRDLDSDYVVSFVRLKNDIKSQGLVKTWIIAEFNLKIEVVKIREVYNFIKEKLLENPKYLWKE